MSMHVITVKCPLCDRDWTGSFDSAKEITDDDKVCKDCKATK